MTSHDEPSSTVAGQLFTSKPFLGTMDLAEHVLPVPTLSQVSLASSLRGMSDPDLPSHLLHV